MEVKQVAKRLAVTVVVDNPVHIFLDNCKGVRYPPPGLLAKRGLSFLVEVEGVVGAVSASFDPFNIGFLAPLHCKDSLAKHHLRLRFGESFVFTTIGMTAEFSAQNRPRRRVKRHD